MDFGKELLSGRPQAGLDIFWRTSRNEKCNIEDLDSTRYLGVEIDHFVLHMLSVTLMPIPRSKTSNVFCFNLVKMY